MSRRRRGSATDPEVVELAALADGSLPQDRRATLEAEVAASPELTGRLAEQRRALTLIHGAAGEVEAPLSLRARLGEQPGSRRRPAPRHLAWIGAAATAALAIALAVTLIGSQSSPERFHATLAATGLIPGAAGDASLTKTSSGWRIELNATGLPRLDDGRFYEAWLKNADGVLVPIGTFNEGSNVTLWAGVSPKDFSTLTITREQGDGDQGSSGEKVLVGATRPED